MKVPGIIAISILASAAAPDFSAHFVVERRTAVAVRVWGSRSNFAASPNAKLLWWAENGPPAPSLKELDLGTGQIRTIRSGLIAEKLLAVPNREKEILALHKVGIGATLTGYTLSVVSATTGEEREMGLDGSTSEGGIAFSPGGDSLVTGVDFDCDAIGRCDPRRFLVIALDSGKVEGEIGKRKAKQSDGKAPVEVRRRRAVWLDNDSIEIQQEGELDCWTSAVMSRRANGQWREAGQAIEVPKGALVVTELPTGSKVRLRSKAGDYVTLSSADVFGRQDESISAILVGDRIVFLCVMPSNGDGWQNLEWKVARWR